MSKADPTPLRLCAVDNKRTTNDFIRVPWAVYADDPHWIPPLELERKEALSPKQPVFERGTIMLNE